jgi:hypothetical protein
MPFEIDVLIIYADRDNEPSGTSEMGWIMQFKNFLEILLEQVSGKKPAILLKGEHDTLTSPRLDNAAVLVAVVSEGFVESQRCLEYVDVFVAGAKDASPAYKRMFKVFKSPISSLTQPEKLRELVGYSMFHQDPETGEVLEYANYFTAEAEQQYWMEIVDLSYDISTSLATLATGVAPNPVKNIFPRKTIYLAETGHDLSVQRNIVTRELHRLGYTILPDQSLPGNLKDLEQTVTNNLSKCSMSIHLIGSAYGEIPEGTDKSIQELQTIYSAQRSVDAKKKEEDFSRLIWIAPNLDTSNDRQRRFIETLKREVEAQEGTEILQTLLEEFKSVVREELEENNEKKVLEDTGGRAIYLMHDNVDHQAVRPFIDVIQDAGFNILMPSFEGELLELRQKHIENLRNLDAAIIFKGQVNEQWVRMKALDLLKAPGFGRKKPIIGKAVVTAMGSLSDKEPFKNLDLRVIDGDEAHSLASLRSYLQEFKP